MTWEIKNRFTGVVIRSGEGELRDADLQGADLRDANLWDADLQGADLRDANLQGANLQGAKLRDANLQGANLRDANLWDANLRDANLQGANLRDSNIIDLGQRSDGKQFYLQLRNGKEPMVISGCRYFTLSKARAFWNATRPVGQPLGDETRAILDHGERLMAIRSTYHNPTGE